MKSAISLLAVCLAVALAAGCVRVEEKRPIEGQTTLLVGRAGDSVELSWKTEPGKAYMLLCSEDLGAKGQWRPVPGAEMLVGTGEKITFKDTVPASEKRYYRLQIMRSAPSR
jgi:hypothetical protein